MNTWVLFIWLTSGVPIASMNYDTGDECSRAGQPYKKYICVKVFVPKP